MLGTTERGRYASTWLSGVSATWALRPTAPALRGRLPLLTLTRQLIDTSGTMSGGGTRVQRGAMSSMLAAEAVQPMVIRRYEKDSEDALRHYEAAQQEARGLRLK